MKLRIGFNVWGQFATWDELIEAGRTIDGLGFDALWASDHFIPSIPKVDGAEQVVRGPMWEGWMLAAGWAAATSRVTVGTLVSAAGYRSPVVMVKMASALDHLSGGRAILGIGAGWFAAEHAMFGFDLLDPAARFDRFGESVAVARLLLDADPGTPVSHDGRHFTLRDAVNDPAPLQRRLPLMVAGEGERRTIPIVARYADMWNVAGDPATLAGKARLLDEACARAGRDPRAVRRTAHRRPALIRSTRDEAIATLAESYARHAIPWTRALELADASPNVGTVEDVVTALADVARAGFDEVSFELPLPYDRPTLEALAGPVRDRLAGFLA